MKTPRLRLAAALALSLNLALAGVSAAQTAEDLGPRVAHELFTAVDMHTLVREAALKNAGAIEQMGSMRPEWKALAVEAMDEAVTREQPAIDQLIGRAFAKTFSVEELSAALTVFTDPQARAVFMAMSQHRTPPGGAASCGSSCMKAMSSPAGQRFMTKLGTALTPDLQKEMAVAIIPDFFIVFGEKAKAAEAKRARP